MAKIIVEQSEGLIVAIWSDDPTIEVKTFYAEDDPPEVDENDQEFIDYEETLAACRKEIEDGHMVDILQGVPH